MGKNQNRQIKNVPNHQPVNYYYYIYNPLITIKHGIFPPKTKIYELLIGPFYVGNGWVAGGCWDDDITSDEMDHSRKFPAFSASKN